MSRNVWKSLIQIKKSFWWVSINIELYVCLKFSRIWVRQPSVILRPLQKIRRLISVSAEPNVRVYITWRFRIMVTVSFFFKLKFHFSCMTSQWFFLPRNIVCKNQTFNCYSKKVSHKIARMFFVHEDKSIFKPFI